MTHGRTNAVMLPHVVQFNMSGSPEKYARVAALMGQDAEGLPVFEAAQLAALAIQELLKKLGSPDYRLAPAHFPVAFIYDWVVHFSAHQQF